MALTKCPECAHDLSSRAPACPHCGFPVTTLVRSRTEDADREIIRVVEPINQGISLTSAEAALDEDPGFNDVKSGLSESEIDWREEAYLESCRTKILEETERANMARILAEKRVQEAVARKAAQDAAAAQEAASLGSTTPVIYCGIFLLCCILLGLAVVWMRVNEAPLAHPDLTALVTTTMVLGWCVFFWFLWIPLEAENRKKQPIRERLSPVGYAGAWLLAPILVPILLPYRYRNELKVLFAALGILITAVVIINAIFDSLSKNRRRDN